MSVLACHEGLTRSATAVPWVWTLHYKEKIARDLLGSRLCGNMRATSLLSFTYCSHAQINKRKETVIRWACVNNKKDNIRKWSRLAVRTFFFMIDQSRPNVLLLLFIYFGRESIIKKKELCANAAVDWPYIFLHSLWTANAIPSLLSLWGAVHMNKKKYEARHLSFLLLLHSWPYINKRY